MKVKRLIIDVMVCVTSLNVAFAQKITGTVLDEKQKTLPGVTCVLLSETDSTQISGTITGLDGKFELPAQKEKEYVLQLSYIGYESMKKVCKVGNVGNIILKESVQQLKEVLVTPQTLKTFGNKDQILLTERAKKIGNNAFDAIESLPQFKKNIGSDDLLTADNKSILVLIDGIRSSSRDLFVLKANDIKNITFYSNPPARYAHENIGAVIDVITKRRSDRQYSMSLNTKNGVTTGYGTNVLFLSYRDSLNMFSATYLIDYRDLNKNLMNNKYEYSESKNTYRGISGSYVGRYHIGQFIYQRNHGKNFWNIKTEIRKSPATQKYIQEINSQDKETIENGTNSRKLKSNYTAYSADLYYTHTFTDKRSLSLNAVNTYYTSSSDNNLYSSSADYSFENHIDNNSYSIIGEALYCEKIYKGDFNVGAYYQYKNLNQTYNSLDKSSINTQKEYIYTDYSNAMGKISYNTGIGFENNRYKTATDRIYNYFIFRPSLALNMEYNKHASMKLTASVKSALPSVGDLTNSKVTIDKHYYSQGNAELKPNYYYYTDLSYQYTSSDDKWYVNPSLTYSYYPHKNIPVLYMDGDDVIQRLTKVDDVQKMCGGLSLSYKPIKWITINPYYNYIYSWFNTPNQSIYHSQHNAGIRLQFLPGEWQIMWYGNFPTTSVNGDIFDKNGFQMLTSALWKHKSISLGAELIYSKKPDKVYSKINGFNFYEETRWNNFRSLIDIKFTYYFVKGKSRNQQKILISNSDADSGLTKYNTAK